MTVGVVDIHDLRLYTYFAFPYFVSQILRLV